jgi:hypothetical protein
VQGSIDVRVDGTGAQEAPGLSLAQDRADLVPLVARQNCQCQLLA